MTVSIYSRDNGMHLCSTANTDTSSVEFTEDGSVRLWNKDCGLHEIHRFGKSFRVQILPDHYDSDTPLFEEV